MNTAIFATCLLKLIRGTKETTCARGDRRRFKIYHTNVGEWKAALCVDPGRIWVRPSGAYYKSTSRLEPQRYVPFTSLERLTERELRR